MPSSSTNRLAGFGVGAQGLGLAPGPVQGEDQQLPQPLAQRMFATQSLQLPDELSVAPQRQIRSGAGLDRHQGQLVQMRAFDVREAGIGELGQRLPPPQRQRLAQRG